MRAARRMVDSNLRPALLAIAWLVSACGGPAPPAPGPSMTASGASDIAWQAREVLAADAAPFGPARGDLLAAAKTVWTEDERGRWTPAEEVEAVDGTQRVGVVEWRGTFVAWDFGNVVHVSPDGVTWSDALVQPDEGNPAALVAFREQLLLLGDGTGVHAGAWRSADGSRWERVDAAPIGMVAGAAGPAGMVAVGSSSGPGPAAWTTPDGVAWSSTPPPQSPEGRIGTLSGVAAGSRGVVVIGDVDGDAAVWGSTDLAQWTRSAAPATADAFLGSVVAIEGGFAIGGRRQDRPVLWLSVDGRSWAAIELPLAADRRGEVAQVVDDHGRLVAFGWTTEDAGNGGTFRTGYLVWTLDRGP